MSNDVAVLFADSHLQDRAWNNRPIECDAYLSFEQIVDYAIRRELPLIGAGDLIDRNVNKSGPIVSLSRQLDRLKEANIPLFYIQGQHEMADVPWLSIGGKGVTQHIHKRLLSIGGVRIYGLDYQPAGKLQEELDLIPEATDVLVAHQVWADFMGAIAAPQGGFHEVPKVSHMFTGDYHVTMQRKVKGKDGQLLHVLSPGSTCMQSIDEPSKKHFAVLTVNDANEVGFRLVPLMTRPFVDWDEVLNQESQLERLLEQIGDRLREAVVTAAEKIPVDEENVAAPGYEIMCEPLLRVIYSHRLERAAHRIAEAVRRTNTKCHLFLKELSSSHNNVSESGLRAVDDAFTMESALPAFLAEREMTHLQDDTLRLLQTQDVVGELERMKMEALQEETQHVG